MLRLTTCFMCERSRHVLCIQLRAQLAHADDTHRGVRPLHALSATCSSSRSLTSHRLQRCRLCTSCSFSSALRRPIVISVRRAYSRSGYTFEATTQGCKPMAKIPHTNVTSTGVSEFNMSMIAKPRPFSDSYSANGISTMDDCG